MQIYSAEPSYFHIHINMIANLLLLTVRHCHGQRATSSGRRNNTTTIAVIMASFFTGAQDAFSNAVVVVVVASATHMRMFMVIASFYIVSVVVAFVNSHWLAHIHKNCHLLQHFRTTPAAGCWTVDAAKR